MKQRNVARMDGWEKNTGIRGKGGGSRIIVSIVAINSHNIHHAHVMCHWHVVGRFSEIHDKHTHTYTQTKQSLLKVERREKESYVQA